jgi:alkylation response protein AidB-like acyl-CoA dehydrogenase
LIYSTIKLETVREMDFEFTAEQEKLRQEVRTFLDKELPPDWVDYVATPVDDAVVHREDGWQVFQDMARKLGEKGWLSLFWPTKYGGQACSHVDYLVFLEEIARRGSPGYNAVSAKMLAPTLMDYGTEEQKERHLKPIGRGEEFWCEGFSEPGAGSDLASLQTKAIKDGNHFIVNGQKTWSTFADFSDWCCLLARSDPHSKRSKGLSFFLVDLSTPGVTVRSIINILGEPDFSEIFFEDVRVPKENLLGPENEGWQVVQAFLSYERATIAPVSVVQTMIQRLVKYIAAHPERDWANSRQTLAELEIETEIGRLIGYRVAWLQDKGLATEWHAGMSRMYNTSLFKRAGNAAMQILGSYGQLDKREDRAPWHGWFEYLFLASIGATIAAGTTEIQRNIIALRGLGLPRE